MTVVAAIIFLLVTNAAGLGALFSVIGLINTQSLFDTSTSKMIEGATAGIVDSLDDPYSKYLDKITWEDLQVRLKAQFGGIGFTFCRMKRTPENCISHQRNPAYEAGVQNGDIIIRINGESAINMSQMMRSICYGESPAPK